VTLGLALLAYGNQACAPSAKGRPRPAVTGQLLCRAIGVVRLRAPRLRSTRPPGAAGLRLKGPRLRGCPFGPNQRRRARLSCFAGDRQRAVTAGRRPSRFCVRRRFGGRGRPLWQRSRRLHIGAQDQRRLLLPAGSERVASADVDVPSRPRGFRSALALGSAGVYGGLWAVAGLADEPKLTRHPARLPSGTR